MKLDQITSACFLICKMRVMVNQPGNTGNRDLGIHNAKYRKSHLNLYSTDCKPDPN